MEDPVPMKTAILIFCLSLPLGAHAQFLNDPKTVSPPEVDGVSPSNPADSLTLSAPDFTGYITTEGSSKRVAGFSFDNVGPNAMVPVHSTDFGSGPDREFSFNFRSRARQDIYLAVTDAPNEYLSHRMESYFYFFPRKNLPAIEAIGTGESAELKVTLPTGEEAYFNRNTFEVLRGALEETAPIDLGPDRFSRKFAGIRYTGSGIVIRVNKRGGDPRLGTIATVSQGKKTCKIPSAMLFNQRQDSDVEFLFSDDRDVNTLLHQKCGMTIP